MRKTESFILTDKLKIKNFIADVSERMSDYLDKSEHSSSQFTLFYKYITHSDLPTFGKAVDSTISDMDRLNSNLLYYPSVEEMMNTEKITERKYPTAKQSNIALKDDFYDALGLDNPRNRTYKLENVYLVNDTLNFFKSEYTHKIFEKTSKNYKNKRDYRNFNEIDITTSEGDFTKISLHVAVHGIGTSDDTEFHKLRHHIFKGDTFIILAEKAANTTKLFIMVEKNPLFFSTLGIVNNVYLKYIQNIRKHLILSATNKENAVNNQSIDDEVTRAQQSEWRKMLAKEIMGYTQNENEVFCPFTYITGDFYQLSPLFVASHIKGFKDENTSADEKYDINNGLLLSSNADKLFDKHLISINEKKELVFSFLIDGNFKLKQQLLLCQPIFSALLNEKRMEYLKYHKMVFDEKEQERRSSSSLNYENM